MKLLATALAVLLTLLTGRVARAQAPDWHGSHLLQGLSRTAQPTATATDAQGNVYVAGTFYGKAQLGSTTLESAGEDDIFIAKWSATTQRIAWAMQMGGLGRANLYALSVQGSSVYALGALMAPYTGSDRFVENGEAFDSFVTKLTDGGTHATAAWTHHLGSPAALAEPVALAVQGAAVFVLGNGYGSVARTNHATSVAGDSVTHFLTKLLEAGPAPRVAWTHEWATTDPNYTLQTLAVQGPRLYVAANTWHDVPHETGPLPYGPQLSRTAATHNQLTITRYTDASTACRPGWTWHDAGLANALAVAGPNVYVVGYSGAAATFGHGAVPLGSHDVEGDMFIGKLVEHDTTARLGWVQRLPTTGYYPGTCLSGVAVRGTRLWVAGTYAGPRIQLGATLLTNQGVGSTRTPDVVVAGLTDAGSTARFEWARSAGGTGADGLTELAVLNHKAYLTGTLSAAPVRLGKDTLEFEEDNDGVPFRAWLPLSK